VCRTNGTAGSRPRESTDGQGHIDCQRPVGKQIIRSALSGLPIIVI
jgi:hypothetical protein